MNSNRTATFADWASCCLAIAGMVATLVGFVGGIAAKAAGSDPTTFAVAFVGGLPVLGLGVVWAMLLAADGYADTADFPANPEAVQPPGQYVCWGGVVLFVVDYIPPHPGTRYYPDGSGEPPTGAEFEIISAVVERPFEWSDGFGGRYERDWVAGEPLPARILADIRQDDDAYDAIVAAHSWEPSDL